jgi:hypothetical protein
LEHMHGMPFALKPGQHTSTYRYTVNTNELQ